MSAAELASTVLALNSGSSSLKFGLYRVGPPGVEVLLSGEAESIGGKETKFHARDSRENASLSEATSLPGPRETIIRIGRLLADWKMPAPVAVGHRIVHGGPQLRRHTLIDASILSRLKAAAAFAPLHTPGAVTVVRLAQERFAGLPQVACFDTAFHVAMPEVARVLPIAGELRSVGLQRYGFHGLSCESIIRQLADDPPDRVIIAHLGAGASITAVRAGKSVDTSMGMTPAGGVIMATRSGDLDPGILVYLTRQMNFNGAMLEDLVDHRSGLLGISGVSGDMRRLHDAAFTNADARLAIQMFCYSVRKQIAAMIAALDGVDLIVFTGGIGENDAAVRSAICGGLRCIGVSLDEARNRSANNPINDPASLCSVRVLPSKEDEQIALHTWALSLSPG